MRAAEHDTGSSRLAEAPEASSEASAAASRDLATASPVDTLREAVETGETVWVSMVDSHGRAVERVVTAHSADLGELGAVDVRSGEVLTAPMSRIQAAHILRRTRKAH